MNHAAKLAATSAAQAIALPLISTWSSGSTSMSWLRLDAI
jgi:hypothetical protein